MFLSSITYVRDQDSTDLSVSRGPRNSTMLPRRRRPRVGGKDRAGNQRRLEASQPHALAPNAPGSSYSPVRAEKWETYFSVPHIKDPRLEPSRISQLIERVSGF